MISTGVCDDFNSKRNPNASKISNAANELGVSNETVSNQVYVCPGRKLYSEETVREAVSFIASHCKTISWGLKRVVIKDGTVVRIPRLIRVDFPEQLFRIYSNSFEDKGEIYLKRRTFLKLVRILTASDEKLISAVDYVSGSLVCDCVNNLKRIVDTFGSHIVERKKMKHYINLVRNALKYQYSKIVTNTDDCSNSPELIPHNVEFGLKTKPQPKTKPHYSTWGVEFLRKELKRRGLNDKGKSEQLQVRLETNDSESSHESDLLENLSPVNLSDERYSEKSATEACTSLKFVDWFMLEKLPNFIDADKDQQQSYRDDAKLYVIEAYEKFLLFRAHKMRAINQNLAIQKSEEELIEHCKKSKNTKPLRIKATADYKMKWEALYKRELTVHAYGKRGVSWHGFFGKLFVQIFIILHFLL